MAEGDKWFDWKKFATLAALVAIAWLAVDRFGLAPNDSVASSCFDFGDGTTQGWTIDQLYDTATGKTITSAQPGGPPHFNYKPFNLTNHNNLALQANSTLFVVPDNSVNDADFFLVSPDLSGRSDWQGISGYKLDLRREFTSAGGEPKNRFFAQLQMVLTDKATGKSHTAAPKDANGKFIFHEMKLNTATALRFEWGDKIELSSKTLGKGDYAVQRIRIRYTMPARYLPELWLNGSWKIGNVCALK